MKQLILTQKKIHSGNLILVNQEFGCLAASPDFPVPVLDNAPDILFHRSAGALLSRLMEEIGGFILTEWRKQDAYQRQLRMA